MATVGAVELIPDLRFEIRMTPPATTGITTKMIEVFQSNIHQQHSSAWVNARFEKNLAKLDSIHISYAQH